MVTLKKTKIGFQDRLSLNASQKFCRMLQSLVFSTFIKLSFAINILCLSIVECPLKTDFTVVDRYTGTSYKHFFYKKLGVYLEKETTTVTLVVGVPCLAHQNNPKTQLTISKTIVSWLRKKQVHLTIPTFGLTVLVHN